MSDEQFEGLLGLVQLEFEDALTAYGPQFDNKTMPRTACFAPLGPSREGFWVDRRGERLGQAVHREQRVTTGLLQGPGLAQLCGSNASPHPAREDPPSPPINKCPSEPEKSHGIKELLRFGEVTEPEKSFRICEAAKTRTENHHSVLGVISFSMSACYKGAGLIFAQHGTRTNPSRTREAQARDERR